MYMLRLSVYLYKFIFVWLSLCISPSSSLLMCLWLFMFVCLPSCLYVWLTVRLPLLLSVPRPGKCPNLQPPESCIADYDECEFDDDCFPGKKCCDNSCFKRCVNPSFDPLGSSKLHCRRAWDGNWYAKNCQTITNCLVKIFEVFLR